MLLPADMPHVIITAYSPWAQARRVPSHIVRLLKRKYGMVRVGCPWDGLLPLQAGDIAIHRGGLPLSWIRMETTRLRSLGLRAEIVPIQKLMEGINE